MGDAIYFSARQTYPIRERETEVQEDRKEVLTIAIEIETPQKERRVMEARKRKDISRDAKRSSAFVSIFFGKEKRKKMNSPSLCFSPVKKTIFFPHLNKR